MSLISTFHIWRRNPKAWGYSVAALGIFGILVSVSACQRRSGKRGGGSDLTAAEALQDDVHRLVITQSEKNPKDFKVSFFYPGNTAKSGMVRWGVRSRTSLDGLPNCSKLPYTAPANIISEATPAVPGMVNQPNHSLQLQIDPAKFSKPTDKIGGHSKISIKLQKSGYFAGPMQLEICLDSGTSKMQGWGIPVVRRGNSNGSGNLNLEGGANLDLDDPVAYGKLCAEKMGALPPFDCRKAGEIIPITVDGVEVDYGKHALNMACDRPPYLGLGDQGNCIPYARLGRLDTGKPEVDTVFICRRYKIGEIDAQSNALKSFRGPDVPLHEDVAIVQHNRITGDTCFFQALSGFQPMERSLPTRRVPPPNEEALPPEVVRDNRRQPEDEKALAANEFWITPADIQSFACSGCHDSDPYMMSPYVMQVSQTLPGGKKDFMVPCDPAVPEQISVNNCQAKDGKGLYKLVSRLHNAPNWRPTRFIAPKAPDAQACVSCHRIGNLNTCSVWAGDSGGDSKHFSNFRTAMSKTYPNNTWMPLYTGSFGFGELEKAHSIVDQASWDNQFKRGKDALRECCDLQGKAGFDEKCTMSNTTSRPSDFRGAGVEPTETTVFTAANLPAQIADGSTTVIPLVTSGEISKRKLAYRLSLSIKIKHEYIGQLKIKLRKGGPANDIGRIDFDEYYPLEPDVLIYDGSASQSPSARSVNLQLSSDQLNSALAPLIGAPALGAWQLVIEDSENLETGQVDAVELQLKIAE